MNIKTSKSFTKEDEILTKGIIEIYKEILSGDRGRFPNGIWKRPDAKENAKKCVRYLIEDKLQWSEENIKENLSVKTFRAYKLFPMLCECFDSSPYKAICSIYPNKFKQWEFRIVSNNYWNKEHGIEATKCLIEEKLKLTDKELKEQLSVKLFIDNDLANMLNSCFENSPWKAIEATYPNRFKPWEFSSIPRSYWNKENSIKATRWLIEEKLKLSDEQIKESISTKIFRDNNLGGMLSMRYNSSPWDAINTVYPGRFKPWEFKRAPNKYWTRETCIEAVKWLIEEKLKLSDEQIKEKLSLNLFRENNLGGMMTNFFNNSPFEAINLAYPNKFKKLDFKNYKNKEE